MERILIISATEKSHAMLSQFLTSCHVQGQICFASSGSEARRMLVDGMFDLVLVNTPLPDEFGHELAQTVTHDTMAGVILLAKAEIADSVSEKVEDDGVFVIPKPLSRVLFTQALRMTRAARQRLTGLQSENRRLQQRIEDIRAVDRAKCLLIECCSMIDLQHPRHNDRVITDLASTCKNDQIIFYDLLDPHCHLFPVPPHCYRGAVQDRQFIHQLFRLQFLGNLDHDVQDNDRDKEHIRIRTYSEKERRNQKIQEIKQRKKILADDL